MKKLLICTFLAAGLSGCVVSGHPSTDRNHSHVDTSSTRYDKYDPNYAYHDETQPRNHRRVYEDFHKRDSDDDSDDDNLDNYYDDNNYRNMPRYYKY